MKRYRIITDSMTPEPTTYSDMITDIVECETYAAREHIKDIEHQIIDYKFMQLYESKDSTKQIDELERTKTDWQRVIETLDNLRGEHDG